MRSEEDPRLMNCYYGRNIANEGCSPNHIEDSDLYVLKSKIVPPVCPKCPDCTLVVDKDSINELQDKGLDDDISTLTSDNESCPGCHQKNKIVNSNNKSKYHTSYSKNYNNSDIFKYSSNNIYTNTFPSFISYN